MAAAYSMDLRKRVIQDSDADLTSKELATRYHVSRAWVDALKQRRRETGSMAPRKQTKFRGRVLQGQEDRLRALVTAQPDATLAELREALRRPSRGPNLDHVAAASQARHAAAILNARPSVAGPRTRDTHRRRTVPRVGSSCRRRCRADTARGASPALL